MNKKTKQMMIRFGGIILLVMLALFINYNRFAPDTETSNDVTNLTDCIEVHFIDVGQGDAILIEAGNNAMLIDAGENTKGTTVVKYLEAQNITNLNYVIGTHPHSDHIGGLDMVINAFPVGIVIMPSVTHTTKTFEELLDTLEENNLTIKKAIVGDKYSLGHATFTIVSPNTDTYEELNNYSVGIKLTFGSTSFLLTGDAEKLSEEEMLASGIDLSADVIKLSHHGSSYSSCADYLDAVNPTYAMISVGKDNQYNHPHAETLQTLFDREIKVYRTDEQGTVVFTSDGKNISVNTEDYEITSLDLEK